MDIILKNTALAAFFTLFSISLYSQNMPFEGKAKILQYNPPLIKIDMVDDERDFICLPKLVVSPQPSSR